MQVHLPVDVYVGEKQVDGLLAEVIRHLWLTDELAADDVLTRELLANVYGESSPLLEAFDALASGQAVRVTFR